MPPPIPPDSAVPGPATDSLSRAERAVDECTNPSDKIWQAAIEQWANTLEEKDFAGFEQTPTYSILKKHLAELKEAYSNRLTTKILERVNPFLQSIQGFSGALDTFAGCETVLCILWGSLKLVIQLASKSGDALEKIVEMIEKLETHLPRIDIYLKAFSKSERVEHAVMQLFCEIIGFFVSSIDFLRHHPLLNTIRSVWSSFDKKFSERLARINECRDNIELEAFAANVERDTVRHEELKGLLMRDSDVRKPKYHLPCHIIGIPRNPKFFGREADLSFLENRLVTVKGTSSVAAAEKRQLSAALIGLGGLGKTQIAAKFAWDHLDKFGIIFWAQADSASKLEQAFLNFGTRVGISSESGAGIDAARVVSLVKEFLADTDVRWLIVFDNVEDSNTLKPFWPIATQGSILLTARSFMPQLITVSLSRELEPLDESVGSRLLLGVSPTHGNRPEDVQAAGRLSVLMGGLPLALVQIGGYVSTAQCSLSEFLDIYEEELRVGNGLFPHEGSIDLYYEYTLDTVWNVTFAKLNPGQTLILGLMAFLDPDSVPDQLIFKAATTELTEDHSLCTSKAQYFNLLKTLTMYNLVRRDQDRGCLAIHRLVQQATIQRMSDEKWLQILDAVVHLLSLVFPRQLFGMAMDREWDECGRYLPQVLAMIPNHGQVMTRFSKVDSSAEMCRIFRHHQNSVFKLLRGMAELLHHVTWYMQERGMFDRVVPIVETAKGLVRLDSPCPENELLLAELENTIGNVHLEVGNLDQCKASFLEVKKIRARNCPPVDPSIANVLENLSLAETGLRNYDAAIELSYRAMHIREQLTDAKYAAYIENTVPTNYSNLCRILYTAGRFARAAAIGEQGIALAKKAFGTKSRNTAQAIFNFADVRMRQGYKEEALNLHLQALRLREEVLGRHYQTAGSCYKVALILQERGDLENAQQLLEKALDIYEESFSQAGGAARTMFKLGELLILRGSRDKGLKLQQEAAERRASLTGSAPEDGNPDGYDDLIPYVDR
ncbi:hypothetical protein QBC47DRAFT_413146 [Echria macrotheca]|uniref:NB-ARC domain-containing protein n=1 Tax=Echria macrotheca TaxID=438768 RepID=A0AAJ0FCZ0_9PEZI|nr:hypothetical protein QBC47DRAFT_413146 [Echria macrotheca]